MTTTTRMATRNRREVMQRIEELRQQANRMDWYADRLPTGSQRDKEKAAAVRKYQRAARIEQATK